MAFSEVKELSDGEIQNYLYAVFSLPKGPIQKGCVELIFKRAFLKGPEFSPRNAWFNLVLWNRHWVNFIMFNDFLMEEGKIKAPIESWVDLIKVPEFEPFLLKRVFGYE